MPIRVMIAGLPRVLRDILEAVIARQDDITLVGVAGDDDLLEVMRSVRPDAVILRQDASPLPDLGRRILRQDNDVKVFGVAEDGRRTFLYEVKIETTPVGEVSPEELLDALRHAVTAGAN